MRRIFAHPLLFVVLVTIVVVAAIFSSVPLLWVFSLGAMIAALVALGWHLAPPVLAWIIAFNMLSVWADIATIELSNSGKIFAAIQQNLPDAIINSSWALSFLAVGMRLGLLFGRAVFGYRPNLFQHMAATNAPYSAYRITLAYAAFLPISVLLGIVSQIAPGLSQPVHVLGLLKYVLIYLLAARVIATGNNFKLLIGVLFTEIIIGSTGYFSGYKEGFFVVLIALAASKERFTFRQFAVSVAGVFLIVYISLAWTAVKMEYRTKIVGSDAITSLSWLAKNYFGGDINYRLAAIDLVERVGYTKFYALVMQSHTDGLQGIYQRAILHIIMPRMFFPDKPVLDDSAQTFQALGWSIADGTSIGLGYVAQAHIDFGFPGLLAPMVLLGAIVSIIYTCFLTRPAPLLIREAFAVACLYKALIFEANIDKQLGGMIMAFIVLLLVLRFGGGILHRWLGNQPPRKNGYIIMKPDPKPNHFESKLS